MKKVLKTVVFAAVLCILFTGCQKQPQNGLNQEEQIRYTANFLDVFDTQTTIVAYAESQEAFDEKVELLKEKLKFYHRLYDIYHSYEGINNIKTINDNAGNEPVVVDKEIIALLKMSQEMYEKSSGQVNVAMGSVLSIWHEYREFGREYPEEAVLPSMEELKNAEAHTDIYDMIVDEDASTVYLKDSEMSLDVGGIGKGYAVQKTVEYAREIGLSDALISVGGNVCALGTKKDGVPWKIGIQNPDLDGEDTYVEKVEVTDGCIVTSGDYQRYYTVDGVKYCHIIDPDTLMPADYFAAVTIIAKDSGQADALSTAVFNMNLEDGMKLIESFDDVEALWVMKDGSLIYSEGFDVENGFSF